MPQLPPDLDQQIKHFIATGNYQTEEEVLRDALRALDGEHHVHDDFRQGLEDIAAGRGRPLKEVDDDLRKKHCIAQDA